MAKNRKKTFIKMEDGLKKRGKKGRRPQKTGRRPQKKMEDDLNNFF